MTYAELAQRNIEYATAIKTVDPRRAVFGPVNYGWAGYVNLQGATDSHADGDFLSWWLGQMKAAETSCGQAPSSTAWTCTGTRRSATAAQGRPDCRINSDPKTDRPDGGLLHAAGQAGQAAEREQAPRSLWDSTYAETSWITSRSSNEARSTSSR